MAYKKYIKRGGKVYGPYIYHSKRVDGKVVSEYRGSKKFDPKKVLMVLAGVLSIFILAGLLLLIGGDISGRAILEAGPNYQEGEIAQGTITLSIDEEDNLSNSSKLVFENNGQIVYEEAIGEVIYPEVYFTLLVYTPVSDSNDSEVVETVNQTQEETQDEQSDSEETNQTSLDEEDSVNESSQPSLIANFFLSLTPTGSVIQENEAEVNGIVSYGEEFRYSLEEGQSAEVKSRSVIVGETILSEGSVGLNYEDGEVIVTTDYLESDLEFELSDFNIVPEEGSLIISIVDGDVEITSFEATVGSQQRTETENEESSSEESNETSSEDQSTNESYEDAEVLVDSELVLTSIERSIILREFGENAVVEVEDAFERDGLIVVVYSLGEFTLERSYPSSIDQNSLDLFMERDRIKFLKDIAESFSQDESVEDVDLETNFTI